MKKALVFGTGKNYTKFINQIKNDFEVIGLIENDIEKQGKQLGGYNVLSLKNALELSYDVIIVTPELGRQNIIQQLKDHEVEGLKILTTAKLSPFLIDPMFFNELNENEKKTVFKNNVETVYIECNSKCNRKCWFCPNSFIDRQTDNNEMEIDALKKILSQLAEVNFSGTIDFSYYNEPLFDSSIEEKIRLVKGMLPNVLIHIVTNGDYLDIDKVKKLEQAGLDRIIISNYFADVDADWTYELATEMLNKKAEKLECSIEYNTSYNDDFIEARSKYGNLDIKLNSMNFKNVGYSRAKLLDEVINEKERKSVCSHPYHGFIIAYNGDVVFCTQCHHGSEAHKDYVCGNVNEDSIFDIFTGEKFSNLRKQTLENLNAMPCTGCTSEITDLVYTPATGPFISRPRDFNADKNYLERSLYI